MKTNYFDFNAGSSPNFEQRKFDQINPSDEFSGKEAN